MKFIQVSEEITIDLVNEDKTNDVLVVHKKFKCRILLRN